MGPGNSRPMLPPTPWTSICLLVPSSSPARCAGSGPIQGYDALPRQPRAGNVPAGGEYVAEGPRLTMEAPPHAPASPVRPSIWSLARRIGMIGGDLPLHLDHAAVLEARDHATGDRQTVPEAQ